MCGLDHHEINEIRTKIKLKKENVLRCFELLQIACLDPDDSDLHEAYRKYVLRKFTESRDLLLPYFKFENFAEQSMYTFNKQVKQEHRIVEKCCLGNGQLTCMVGSNDPSIVDPYSQAAMDGVNSSAIRPPPLTALSLAGGAVKDGRNVLTKAPGYRSPNLPIKPNLSIELPANGSRQRGNQPASDSAAVKASVTFGSGVGMK